MEGGREMRTWSVRSGRFKLGPDPFRIFLWVMYINIAQKSSPPVVRTGMGLMGLLNCQAGPYPGLFKG